MACQMATAVFDQVVAEIDADDQAATLRAVGTTMKFDGFLRLYREGRDDSADEDEESPETTYDGEGGVEVGGLFRKLLYAVKFSEPNFLLSSRLGKKG